MRTARITSKEYATTALARWLAMALCAGACARSSGNGREPPAPQPPAAAAPAPAAPATTTPTPTPGNLLVTETEYQGWRYFHVYCARCHGQDALGSLDAANLRYSITEEGGVTPDSFVVIVRNGSDNKEMPPFHELLDDERIRYIYAYIKARSEGRLAVGRPRRAPAAP
jgi:mono/diheme cytochrome c family protein